MDCSVRSATPVLEAIGLTKTLGARAVVDGVSLQVSRGEVIGLLGPNGAGKTTIFRVLAGVLAPDSGQVLLGGRDISRARPHERSLAGLGYLPQGPSVFAGLTVRDNLRAVLQIRGAPDALADETLEELGLAALGRRRAATLSGGERRRLELARALVVEPRVVLLDEPFKGLDPRSVSDLSERVAGLAARGGAVLLTDHAVDRALASCHRTYILVDGRVVSAGAPQTVVDHEVVRSTFLALGTRD